MSIPLYSDGGEEARVLALESLRVLDTEPEARFDRICRLAQDVMRAPVAYISFLDRDRQWFKANCGLEGISETPRLGSFCDYAIRRSQPTLVLDASADPLFSQSPYVQGEPFVRFYLGFPLLSQGQRVGTLCTLDFEPREGVTPEQLDHMTSLARQVENELHLSPRGEPRPPGWSEEAGRRILGSGVRSDVAEHVLRNPSSALFGGERRPVTVLRASLRGLEDLTEGLAPDLLVGAMNFFLEHVTRLALSWQGTVETLTGPNIRIVFGAPLPSDDAAARAAACAVGLQQLLPTITAALEREGLPQTSVVIGLASGEAVTGLIGSQQMLRYSAVGGPVSRVEAIAEMAAGGQILCDEVTIEQLVEVALVRGPVRVRLSGDGSEVSLFELAGIAAPPSDEADPTSGDAETILQQEGTTQADDDATPMVSPSARRRGVALSGLSSRRSLRRKRRDD